MTIILKVGKQLEYLKRISKDRPWGGGWVGVNGQFSFISRPTAPSKRVLSENLFGTLQPSWGKDIGERLKRDPLLKWIYLFSDGLTIKNRCSQSLRRSNWWGQLSKSPKLTWRRNPRLTWKPFKAFEEF